MAVIRQRLQSVKRRVQPPEREHAAPFTCSFTPKYAKYTVAQLRQLDKELRVAQYGTKHPHAASRVESFREHPACELVGVSAPGTQAAWSPDEMSYLTNDQNPPGRIAPNVPFVNNHYVSEEVAQAWMFGDGPERMCYCEHCVFAMAESGDIVITQCSACVGQPRELTPRVPAAHASESAGYMVAASDGSQTRVGAVGGGADRGNSVRYAA